MYGSAFSRLYDAFGWNEYPRALGGQMLTWLEKQGAVVRKALDLGCGTGVLCGVLADAGIDTLGVDLSENMIDIARRSYPDLRFEVGDMTAFQTDERFDLVTCTGDALNHLPDIADIGSVFRNVRSALNDGGYFIFDLLDPGEVPDGEPFEADYSEHERIRFSAETDREGNVRLHIASYEDHKLRFEERIEEKLHPLGEVLDILRGAGFEVIQCADRLLLDSDVHGTTRFIAARAV